MLASRAYPMGQVQTKPEGQLITQAVPKPEEKFLEEVAELYEAEGSVVAVEHAALAASTLLTRVLVMPTNAVAVEDSTVPQIYWTQWLESLHTSLTLATVLGAARSITSPSLPRRSLPGPA